MMMNEHNYVDGDFDDDDGDFDDDDDDDDDDDVWCMMYDVDYITHNDYNTQSIFL